MFLSAGVVLDHEAQAALNVTVNVDDGAIPGDAGVSTDLIIAINDVNEEPTVVALTGATAAIDENTDTAVRIKVADIAVTDDALGTNTPSLSGADAGLFEIDGTELFLSAGVVLDHEAQAALNVTVNVDDGAIPGDAGVSTDLIIAINDVNEEPTVVALTGATAAIDENTDTAVRIKVADIAVTDDALGTNTPSLSGADAGLFEIDGTELFLSAGVVLDHEAQAALNVTVNVDDGTIPGDAGVSTDLIIAINDVNEEPTNLSLTSLAIDENVPAGTIVGVFSNNDPDDGETFTYTLTSDPSGFFEITGNQVRIAAGANIDYETATSHDISVQVADSVGHTHAETFTLLVWDGTGELTGTSGDDVILGSENADIVHGLGGSDRIETRGGDDHITVTNKTGAFTDVLDGGSGTDTLTVSYGAITGAESFVSLSYSGGTSATGTHTWVDGNGGTISFENIEELNVGGVDYQIVYASNYGARSDVLDGANSVSGTFYSATGNRAVLFDNGNFSNFSVSTARGSYGGKHR